MDRITIEDWDRQFGLVTDAPKRERLSSNGLHFREWRQRAGLTMAQVAYPLGMTAPQYSRIERGETNITLDVVIRISEALGCASMTDLRELPPEALPPNNKAP